MIIIKKKKEIRDLVQDVLEQMFLEVRGDGVSQMAVVNGEEAKLVLVELHELGHVVILHRVIRSSFYQAETVLD